MKDELILKDCSQHLNRSGGKHKKRRLYKIEKLINFPKTFKKTINFSPT